MFSLVGNPKRVALAKLIFEGHQEFDTEEVREMEASFADTGGEPLQVPLVEKETFKVITGRTRLKALKRAGRKDVLVQFATGSRADLARASIIENLRRRHDSPHRCDQHRHRAVPLRWPSRSSQRSWSRLPRRHRRSPTT